MEDILIEKVREHECLYNIKSTNYRDVNIRHIAWEEIGRELKIPASEAKGTWEKLRRCFSNARNRRREETKSGMAAKKISKWKYEEQMAFIIPFLETRRTHSNLIESQSDILSVSQVVLASSDNVEENIPQPEQEENVLLPEFVDDLHESVAKRARIETVPGQYEAIKINRNEKRKDTPAHKLVEILQENAAIRKRRYEETNLKNLDETDMFFLSMSRMTKQLPKVEQAKIKLNLSNSVLTAELNAIQQQHPLHQIHISPSPSPHTSLSETINSVSDYSSGGDKEQRSILCNVTDVPFTNTFTSSFNF